MSGRSWTVACLAGDGVGPELMAESSRVLAEVGRLHSLRLDDVHLPFGGEALTRFGHHPGTVDLVVAGSHLAGAIVDAAAHLSGSLHTVAGAWLSETGPGLFAAHVVDADEVAGFGVADPAGTLLAASLLLGEGLGA